MATTCEYQHKKFSQKNKRTYEDMENKENIVTAQTILENALKDKDIQPEQPLAKRRQTKPLFRPWEDDKDTKCNDKSDSKSTESSSRSTTSVKVLSNIPINVESYNPKMARKHSTKSRTEKEQQRRIRNNMACLINRRKKEAEQQMLQQQYIAYQQQHAAQMEQSVRAALYLRHLQQLAWQRQQQLFVFGQQQS